MTCDVMLVPSEQGNRSGVAIASPPRTFLDESSREGRLENR